jgi:hypothetical protein
MEILINELSLKGQFSTVDEFIVVALKPLLSLLQQYDSTRDILLRKYDLYDCKVTSTVTLHALFKGSYSRTCDEIRKSKSQLAALMDDPYWQDNRKHDHPDTYKFNTNVIFDSSLAESCERDRVVMSFISDEYNSTTLDVAKNTSTILIDNLFNHTHLYTLVRARGLVVAFSLTDTSRFKKTNFERQGQLVYKELRTKCFWYLDNLHRNHYEVFDSNESHLGIADLSGKVDTSKRENGRIL